MLLPGLAQPRPVALLSMLAVARGKGVTRDRLAALLWEDTPEIPARQRLSDTIYHIHRALGADAVTTAGQVVYLNPGTVSTDLGDFLDAIRRGDRERAVELYRGPLLDGFHVSDAPAFDEWLEPERRRVSVRFTEALEALARTAEEAGDYAEAARRWRRLLADDPLNSPAAIALARALAATGDHGNALKVLEAHQTLLREEVGLDAGPGVPEAMAQIRADATAAVRPGAPRIAALPVQSVPPITAPAADAAIPATPAPAMRARRGMLTVAAAGTVVALLAVAMLMAQWLKPTPLTIAISDITPVTTEPGVEFQPAISPDGKQVAYVAGPVFAQHLVIRNTANVAGGGEVRAAESSLFREWYPSWSPDGASVRFRACGADGCVWNEIGSLGGMVRPVPLPRRARDQSALAWSSDGSRVAFVVADTVFVSSTADTTPHPVVVHRAGYWGLHSLAWSPDGKLIAYVNGNPGWQTYGNLGPSSIWIVSAKGGEPRLVTTDDDLNVSPTWLDARHVLYVSDRDGPRGVYVVEVGPRGRHGEPRIVPGVADPHSISYSIGARKLAYARFTHRQNIWAYPLGRRTAIPIEDGVPVTSGSQVVEMSDVSPDGKWLAFDSNVRGRKDLFKIPLGGGDVVALTAMPGNEEGPRWSPDGREIAFHHYTAADSEKVMVVSADGGPPVALTDGPGADVWPVWSPDGLSLAFLSNRSGSRRLWLLARDSVGGAWHETGPLADCPPFNEINWVPDGSGVLCDTNRDLVVFTPQGKEIWRRTMDPASGLFARANARYSRDGRIIYQSGRHRDGRAGVWAIPVAGRPLRLVIAAADPSLAAGCVSLGPDRLYLTVYQYESDIWVANLQW